MIPTSTRTSPARSLIGISTCQESPEEAAGLDFAGADVVAGVDDVDPPSLVADEPPPSPVDFDAPSPDEAPSPDDAAVLDDFDDEPDRLSVL